MKAYDNITALLKSVLKTVTDPPGGLKKSVSIYPTATPMHITPSCPISPIELFSAPKCPSANLSM